MELTDDIWYYIFEIIIKEKSVPYVCYNYTTINTYFNNVIYNRIKRAHINSSFIVTNKRISDTGLASLMYLEKLIVIGNSSLKSNKKYDFSRLSSRISDCGIENLTNLKTLILKNTKNCITDITVRYLTNITELGLIGNEGITSYCIHYLTNLKSLDLSNNKLVSGICFKYLYTSLTHLNISHNNKIMPQFLTKLTSLSSLTLRDNIKIFYNHITMLTNLTCLSLRENVQINPFGITTTLTNLTSLTISICSSINTGNNYYELSNDIDNTIIDNTDIITYIKNNKLSNLPLKNLTIFDFALNKPDREFHKFSCLINCDNTNNNIKTFYRQRNDFIPYIVSRNKNNAKLL